MSQNECQRQVLEKQFFDPDFVHLECLSQCPLECNTTQYKTYISLNELISNKYADNFREKNISMKENFFEAHKNFIKFDIFYDSLTYELSTESSKMDIVSFLANVGGNLGLFLGVSVISICECIEVLVELCIMKMKRRSKLI
jgi:hypothetical protein